ncbi:hypothetical protein Tco_0984556 [Tanacetum coccineum]
MENANPFGLPVPPNVPHDQTCLEVDELLEISAMIDSRLENIDQNQLIITPPVSPEKLLDNFIGPPDFLEIDDLESDVESDNKPLVSLFPDVDEESDDGELIIDMNEYVNTWYYDHDRKIIKFDMRSLSFPCMIGFRQFIAHFDPILSMNIITRKAFNTIMVKELASRDNNLVAIVRNVYVLLDILCMLRTSQS